MGARTDKNTWGAMIKEQVESCTDAIGCLVDSFAEKDPSGKQALQQLLASDAQSFCVAGIRMLARKSPSAGSRYVAHLLSESKYAIAALMEPNTCTQVEAMTAAKAIAESGKKLETVLEMALGRALRSQNNQDSAHVLRILDLLAALSAHSCWNSFQVELMAYPDKAVRSKAALLIGRSNKNAAWISRRLMDRDVRVQANAVEALWELDAAESKPLLLAAVKSKNNRVAANAALGLYRLGEMKIVRVLLDMALHHDPFFRLSALWAVAETQDPRFLPFLTEQFKTAQGKERLAIARALAQIRRREKAVADTGTLQIHRCSASIQHGGRRRVTIALSEAGVADLSALKPTELAIWEAGALVEDYEVKAIPNPAVLITGFVAPYFSSTDDQRAAAIIEVLKRCLCEKRADDLWRVDRFLLEKTDNAPVASEEAGLPYDDALATPELKTRHGCMADRNQIEKALCLPVPRERAAADLFTAVQRQLAAVSQHAGKRHVIVLVDGSAADTFSDEAAMARLKQSAEEASIAIHGVCLDPSEAWLSFGALCRSLPDSSFRETTLERLTVTLLEAFSQQLNRFEIHYSRADTGDPNAVTLKICSTLGGGQAEIELSGAPS
jgi:HEAT repeat protein